MRDLAKRDLIEQLEKRGPLTTGELRGTRRFHGTRTLSCYQIRTLLRETGRASEYVAGSGMYTSTLWSLTSSYCPPPDH